MIDGIAIVADYRFQTIGFINVQWKNRMFYYFFKTKDGSTHIEANTIPELRQRVENHLSQYGHTKLIYVLC